MSHPPEENALVPEGQYRAVITAVEDLGIVDGEHKWRVSFEVDCEPRRLLTKDLNREEMNALARELMDKR